MADYVLSQFLSDTGHGIANGGFSIEGGRYTDVFDITPKSGAMEIALLHIAVKDILGTTQPNKRGGLHRTLPMGHPLFGWMYASAITSVQGIGHKDKDGRTGRLIDMTEGTEAWPITTQYWVHPRYRLTVEFTSRPYAVLSDQSIDQPGSKLTWTEADGTAHSGITFAPEWLRYTDWEYEPKEQTRYAQHGMLQYRRGDGEPGTDSDGNTIGDPPPHLYSFSGFPRIIIPAATVRFRWFQIPFAWVTSYNSALVQYVGHVNQHEWYGWNEAELLYLGTRVLRRYTPPVPDRERWSGSTSYSTAKLCDVELIFEETVRETPSAPTLDNANFKAAGHNLEYWLYDRQAYYVTPAAPDDPWGDADDTPLYFSFPFQFFFTDPDVWGA